MPRERMISHFYRALEVLAPLAREVGTKLLIENMPFAFLPDAEALMSAVDGYGDASIRVIYDVANAHFIGESPTARFAAGSRTGSAWCIFPIPPGRGTSTIPGAGRCSTGGLCLRYERSRILRAADLEVISHNPDC